MKLSGKMKDLTGMKFGHLTAIEPVSVNKHGGVMWKCICDCGNEKITSSNHLTTGRTTGCGDRIHRLGGKNHFHTHGDTNTRLYKIYAGIKSRCNNPNDTGYYLYGERGIKMCAEWATDYETFKKWALKNGYADDLSIDRIDPNGGYSPDNCRWVDKYTQANNKRDNHYITHDGRTMTMMEWSREYGVDYFLLRNRLHQGWSFEDAIEYLLGKG